MSVSSSGERPDIGSVVLGRYRLEERIAVGGMGMLWRATDTMLNSPAALKRIVVAHLPDDRALVTRNRAEREAQLAGKLRGHPHIISIYDIHADDDSVWLVQEYLPSRSLGQLVRQRGTLDPAVVARIGADIADALAAAHAADIQHRDVTPGNVLIGTDGRVKLTDFGIARSMGDPHVTETGAVIGTVSYLAPEVARGDDASSASDMFSLGATLYAALEGQAPFGYSNSAVKMLNIVGNGIIRPPENAGPLQPILAQLLEARPGARPDAATARDALRRIADSGEEAIRSLHDDAAPASAEETTVAHGVAPPVPPSDAPHGSAGHWSDVTSGGAERINGARSGLFGARRRRVVLIAAVLAVLALIAGVLALTHWFGPASDARAGGAAATSTAPDALPDRVPPMSMGGHYRSADTCQLLTTPRVKLLGEPKPLRGNDLSGCRSMLTTADGSQFLIGYVLAGPGSMGRPAGEERDLGGVRVFYRPLRGPDGDSQCEGDIVLSDNSVYYGLTRPLSLADRAPDPCTVMRTVTAGAVDLFNRMRGVPHVDYARHYELAAHDACAVDARTIRRISGPRAGATPGFAGWSCTWGGDSSARQASAEIKVQFQLRIPDEFSKAVDQQRMRVAGATVYQTTERSEQQGDTCTVYLPAQERPGPDGQYQVVQVEVTSPASRAVRCGDARSVAAAVHRMLS